MKNTTSDSPNNTAKVPRKNHDKTSLFITNTFGSVVFLLLFLLFVGCWISWNIGTFPSLKRFDRFPFPELEMIVSIFAVFLSIAVLISQKRQARLEKAAQQVEFEINVRAEKEITKVLKMLHQIEKKLGIEDNDQELEQMKENIDIEE